MTLLRWDEFISTTIFSHTVNVPAMQGFFLTIGVLPVYAVPVVLLWLFVRNRGADRATAVKVFVAAILAWQVLSSAIGSFLYSGYGFRDRPFAPIAPGEFFFERPEKAFPSDHASVLGVVTMMFFALGYPKIGWMFLGLTLLTVIGRVGVGYHYFGDMIGGLAIGVITFAIMRLMNDLLDRLIQRVTPLRGTHEDGRAA